MTKENEQQNEEKVRIQRADTEIKLKPKINHSSSSPRITTECQSHLYNFTTLQIGQPIQPVAVLSPHKFVTLPNLFKVDSQPETTEAAQGGKHTSPQIISQQGFGGHMSTLSHYRSNRDAQHTEAHILSAAQIRAKKARRNVET